MCVGPQSARRGGGRDCTTSVLFVIQSLGHIRRRGKISVTHMSFLFSLISLT